MEPTKEELIDAVFAIGSESDEVYAIRPRVLAELQRRGLVQQTPEGSWRLHSVGQKLIELLRGD